MFLLPSDVCIRDLMFEATGAANAWFGADLDRRDIYLGYAGYLMDFMFISWAVYWWWRFDSHRIIFTLLIFYPTRSLVQNNLCLMGRPEGFLFYDPGIFSITTNYFDTNDFYYSGHIGSCVMFVSEWYALGKRWMLCAVSFIMFNEWLMLTILRTHYLIDFTSGIAVALIFFKLGEKLDYFADVLVMGSP